MGNLYIDIETVKDGEAEKLFSDEWKEKNSESLCFLPEYNKIFCLSYGEIVKDGENLSFKISSLTGDEKTIIESFFLLTSAKNYTITGFNIKNFDIPFILKRAMKHGIRIPKEFYYYNKKPWEVTNILDLYEVYKMIGTKSGSLETICIHLGIKTSKDGIDGSLVQKFVDEGKGEDVVKYCEEDIRATAEVHKSFLKL